MLDVRSNAAQTDQDLDIGYPAQPIDRIQAGREAWDRLSKHRVLDDWFVLGQALVIGRKTRLDVVFRSSRSTALEPKWLGEFLIHLKAQPVGRFRQTPAPARGAKRLTRPKRRTEVRSL